MKTTSLRSFATLASWRFNLFSSASTVIDRRYKLGERHSRSPRLRVSLRSVNLLRSLATLASWRFNLFPSASTVIDRRYKLGASRHPTFKIQHSKITILCILGVLAFQSFAAASTTWTGPTWNVSTVVPDNDDVGITDIRTISIPGLDEIENVTVNLHFTGGWNGDLYAYLLHDSGFSVLLNRPGRSLSALDGSATVGMAITFDDSAVSDIHTAIPMSGGSVSGTYQPDGRETDPYNTLNTDARTAMLADFIGLDPNGTWKLFVADQSAGEESTLQSWSLTITAVPEPSAVMLAALGLFPLFRRKRVCSH
jgi:subtilisin-like proprotein convertase family protein